MGGFILPPEGSKRAHPDNKEGYDFGKTKPPKQLPGE
jgi:hypothetical protein